MSTEVEGYPAGGEWRARHDGPCGNCDRGVHQGEPIVKEDDRWVHAVCPQDMPRPVCPNCWTLVPLTGICASCGWKAAS